MAPQRQPPETGAGGSMVGGGSGELGNLGRGRERDDISLGWTSEKGRKSNCVLSVASMIGAWSIATSGYEHLTRDVVCKKDGLNL